MLSLRLSMAASQVSLLFLLSLHIFNYFITFRYYARLASDESDGRQRIERRVSGQGIERGPNDDRCRLGPRYVFFPIFSHLTNHFYFFRYVTCNNTPPSLETRDGGVFSFISHHHPLPRSKRETEGCSILYHTTTPSLARNARRRGYSLLLASPSLETRDGGAILLICFYLSSLASMG
jgi:hypothetical protein